MVHWLWLVPAAPVAGFVALVIAGRRSGRVGTAILGTVPVAVSTAVAFAVGAHLIASPVEARFFTQTLWTWGGSGGVSPPTCFPVYPLFLFLILVFPQVGQSPPTIGFRVDPLSLVMMLVVTGVSLLILFYSTAFMEGDDGHARFFAYMNLFVGSMLVLVLADNLLLLYLGWEGVGLCSYLLIGFWYREAANARAARKAFIVTRIGDTALAIGLFLLITRLGTLDIETVSTRAALEWPSGSPLAIAVAALLLGGAVGKSAQIPLQTWLPDAMAGPTPVSALIHAATMVTAGVYLIARMHVVFALAPPVLAIVAVIGAVTLLLAGCSALVQRDIKRALAYSTMSQIGYMFLALGVGAWSAAIFHFMTHAFFKALLFLAAGVVIVELEDEHDLFRMGGLRRELPVAFWTFLIGAASLSALPVVTAGFYSKDLILFDAWSSTRGGPWLWLAGLIGALLTSVYAFRLVFLAFFGEASRRPTGRSGWRMNAPLVILAALALVGGLVELPATLGDKPLFTTFLQTVLPPLTTLPNRAAQMARLQLLAGLVSLGGGYIAWALFVRSRVAAATLLNVPPIRWLSTLWFGGWGFDWLYDRLFVGPFVWLARVDRADVVDRIYDGLVWVGWIGWRASNSTQTGRLRWYAAGLAIGALAITAVAILL